MTEMVDEDDALTAWKVGGALVLRHSHIFNLVTTIQNPTKRDVSWYNAYSPKNLDPKRRSLSDVEHTIFPRRIYERAGSRRELYEEYALINGRARAINKKRKGWGTYFDRMINFGPTGVNQLEDVITGLGTWSNNWKAALCMHMSCATLDSVRQTRGFPCLQYIEFICPDASTVELVSVYRNHDFFERALGNFIGLGQLLRFVTDQTGRRAGRVTCHSVHAFHSCRKSDMRAFVS